MSNEDSMKIGDIVRRKADGPKMTVVDVDEDDSGEPSASRSSGRRSSIALIPNGNTAYRKSTSASCHRVSADAQTAAWPSTFPSRHEGYLPHSISLP
jgi:hypothetical protein